LGVLQAAPAGLVTRSSTDRTMERIMPYEEKPSAHCVRPFKVPEEFLEREKVRGGRKVELAPPFDLRPRSRPQDKVVTP